MLLEKIYSDNKNIRDFLKFQCQRLAYVSEVNIDDILSRANEKLALQMHNGFEIVDEQHLYKFVKTVASNSLQDIVRRRGHQTESPTDPMLMIEPDENVHQGYEQKQFLTILDKAIRERFKSYPTALIVYDHTILKGYMIKETSEEFGINMETIKTNMRMVRSFANKIRSQLS